MQHSSKPWYESKLALNPSHDSISLTSARGPVAYHSPAWLPLLLKPELACCRLSAHPLSQFSSKLFIQPPWRTKTGSVPCSISMPPKPIEDRSIVLTSTTGEKSIWRPREYIPPDEVWDTVATARILNVKTAEIETPEETRRKYKNNKQKKQKWWRKLWWKMMSPRRKKVLETGVDTFPGHSQTLLERVSDYWRPTSRVPPRRSSTPRLGNSTLVQMHKENLRGKAAAASTTTQSLASKFYECRGCMSGGINENISHESNVCKLRPSSSATTLLREQGTVLVGGTLNPLADPSMQRARFVHDRARDLIAPSEVPSPMTSIKTNIKPERKGGRNKTVENNKKIDWGWMSSFKKSKNRCDCDIQSQGKLGRMDGETLTRMNSEDSLVNITFGNSFKMSPVLFEIAEDDKTTDLEAEHQCQRRKTLEVVKINSSRQYAMAKRKIDVVKTGSASITSAPPPATPAASVLTLSTTRPESPDRVPTLSLAQRLKALRVKYASKSGDTFEDVWNAGTEGRVQGPAGTIRGESEVESGFVEVDLPASNNTDPKTSHVIACSSRVQYLPAAMEDAINTELPKPMKEDITHTVGGISNSDASSVGGSFKTARSTPSTTSTASTVSTVISPEGSAVNNAGLTKQTLTQSVPSSSRTRSAPSVPPPSSGSKQTGHPTSKVSTPAGPNNIDGPRRSLPTNIKKSAKNPDMTGSYFKVHPQDGTDTGYPALDSSATSSDFGFHPAIVPGSWPYDEDSEWIDAKEEFEAVVRKNDGITKSKKKR
ncbi:hypothetical protein ONS96_013822 [Cadophora gregata f. sp. sojae]|nr:hypothetical protein ONS96_013822 [Cadophora gregata f. sp. sojae]